MTEQYTPHFQEGEKPPEEISLCDTCGNELTIVKGPGGKGTRFRCAKCNRIATVKGKKEKEPELLQVDFTDSGEGLIRVVVYLPSTILTLFYYAKATGLIDHDDIVSFMVEYTQYGFMKAHNRALSLAPHGVSTDGGDNRKDIEELKQIVASLKEDIEKLGKKK